MSKRVSKSDKNTNEEEDKQTENTENENENPSKKQKLDDTPMENEQLLKSMRLKSIIKENHGKEISQVSLNVIDPRFSNLVATIGDCQANIYDNRHFGNNLDLMMHFINKPISDKEETMTYTLRCCCWMKEAGTESELADDSYLALAGDDKRIHILSIKRSKVIIVLEGHTDTIIELCAHPDKPQLLASASKDGTVKLWNIHKQEQLASWSMTAAAPTSLVFAPSCKSIICGLSNGTLTEITIGSKIIEPLKTQDKKHGAAIDCIRWIDRDRLVSKSVDGRLLIWDKHSGKVHAELKVSNTNKVPSKFDISQDAQFLCVGNSEGVVTIFKIDTGKATNKLEHKRSRHAVKSCVFSTDTRNILYVTQDSHLWRFDYNEQPST